MRILVVDDDDILVHILQRSLSSQRHVVDVVEDGGMGWEYVQSGDYELVLLDVNLPGLDGVSLCEKMRAEGYATPILLMTAKNASEDRILGLDAGADDYLIKPLDLGELNARIRALSRRGEVATTAVLQVNGLTLDPSTCQVSYQQKPIKLTAKEYSLLEIFLRNPERVFSRSQILDKIWTFDDPPLEESVKAHVKGLRKKLRKVGIVDWIENVYGIGYRLNAKVDSKADESTSIEQEFDRKLEQMWLKYQAKMSQRMSVLQDAVIAVKNQQLSPEIQYGAERAAHKLAGVLGMFSRDTGTDIAREIETLLQDNQVLNEEQQEKLITLVRDLDSLLALDATAEEEKIVATLLLISEDKQLGDRQQQLAQTQALGWHRVEDINQAKIWLQTNSPQAIVIDLHPNQNEYLSLVAEFSQDYPNIPIIILSDSSNISDRLLAIRKGVGRFLVKPVTPETLWQAVSQSLEKQNTTVASILIVDDDPIFLGTIATLLEPWGIKVHTSESPTDFWQLLPAIVPDLVILDVEMPEINGIELCQTLRNDPSYQDLPVLFLTAKQDAKTIQQIFEIGGDDYIAKPVVGAELIARINNRLERSRLLHSLATQDPLTGLNNRIQSSREIENLLLQSQTNSLPFCLTVLKITDLAEINLKHGYLTGDRILSQWGKVIRAGCRQDEITGYWGNGDFVIAMSDLDITRGKESLTELLATLRRQVFTSPGGKRFQVTFNFATAQGDRDGKMLHSLYKRCCQLIQ